MSQNFHNGEYQPYRQPQPPLLPGPGGASATTGAMPRTPGTPGGGLLGPGAGGALDPVVRHLLNTMERVGPKLPQGEVDPGT